MDRIERQIDIDASADRVWDLVARPGWYINDGEIVEHRTERVGDVDVVRDPVHGAFPIRTERLDPPRYAAFRWLSGEAGSDLGAQGSTLVEFWIDDRPGGGVTLRVVESGFLSLDVTEEERRKRFEENDAGWREELDAALRYLDPLVVTRAVYVAADPGRVWAFLTEPGHVARWYAFDGADVDIREGGRLTFHWREHGTYRGTVLDVDAPHRLRFLLAQQPDTDAAEDAPEVTFTVKAAGAGSLVVVRHCGLGSPEDAASEVDGWENGLRLLAGLVRNPDTAEH
jgi:uncharacterized protein YndB with AHSA1/START domain